MRKVPKIAFTYWSGDTLTYLHLLTLRSILKLNPDFRIIVYTDKRQSTDYIPYNSHEHKTEVLHKFPFSALYSFDGIQIVEVDFQKEFGITEMLFHSYLADITRIKKACVHGGIWFDMDILFLKPFTEDFITLPDGKFLKTCSYSNTIATGLVVVDPKSPEIKKLSELTDEYIARCEQQNFGSSTDYKDHYQSFGPDLWRRVFDPYLDARLAQHPRACALDNASIYPYLWDQMDQYFLGTQRSRVGKNTIGVHWYNGSVNARIFINRTLCDIKIGENPRTPIEHDLNRLLELGVDMTIPRISDFTTSLRGANLQGVNFQNANLRNADLRDANLQNANLQNANLQNADLRGANLYAANLSGANMTNALLEGTSPRIAPSDVLSGAIRTVTTSAVGISIVMAAFNRRAQVLQTLESLKQSRHTNFEVIIVDDASDADQKVEDFLNVGDYSFEIKVITISKEEKTWVNPCVAYNIGVRYATKEVIMLQNAEVMHVGDVLSFTASNIQPKDWLTFNCYGLNKAQTERVLGGEALMYSTVQSFDQRIGGNSVASKDTSGWLNHFDRHFVAYHYCGAIYREDLMRDSEGGFSDDFSNLVGGDDDFFVKQLLYKKYNFKVPAFTDTNPFVAHLFHEKSDACAQWTPTHLELVRSVLFRKILKLGFSPEIDIAKAPKSEIPMSRRVLVQ